MSVERGVGGECEQICGITEAESNWLRIKEIQKMTFQASVSPKLSS